VPLGEGSQWQVVVAVRGREASLDREGDLDREGHEG
jgi:hypothetical protein